MKQISSEQLAHVMPTSINFTPKAFQRRTFEALNESMSFTERQRHPDKDG